MAIVQVQNVPLMSQPTDGVCWMVSAQMVYKWSKAAGKGDMKDPMSDSGSKTRYENNGDWSQSQNGLLAGYFNMKKHSSVTMSCDSLIKFFDSHGPIWTGVQKNWGGNNHGHVVVICGVADTGVFMHDPEPMKSGTAAWMTWDQINKAINGLSGADYQFLTAA